MNAFFQVNRIVGFLFGSALLGFGLYWGIGAAADARKQAGKEAQVRLQKMLEDRSRGLPPGLNGQYPADGPLADHYRKYHSSGPFKIEVAPR